MKVDSDAAIETLANEIKEVSEVVRLDGLVLIMYAGDVVSRYLDMKMRKFGQDLTRFNILYLLVGSGGIQTPTAISKRVFRSKHAISRALDVLEKDGLIERARTNKDRRSVNIRITKKGLQLVRRSLPDLQKASAAAASCLNDERFEELKKLVKELRTHVLNLIGPSPFKIQ
jgi:DNA-binding MarR family transcriptional regulator